MKIKDKVLIVEDEQRIIFNGNGYDDAWIKEATEKRGLLNLRTTPMRWVMLPASA